MEIIEFMILIFLNFKIIVLYFFLSFDLVLDVVFNFMGFLCLLFVLLPVIFSYMYSLKMFYINRWISPDFFFFLFFFVFETNDLDFFLDFWPEVIVSSEEHLDLRKDYFKFPVKYNVYKDWRYFPQLDHFLHYRFFGGNLSEENEKQFREWEFSKIKFLFLKNLIFFLLFPNKFLKNKLVGKEVKLNNLQVFVKNNRLLHNFFNRFFFFNFKYLRQTVIYRRPISFLSYIPRIYIFHRSFSKVENVYGKNYDRFKYYYYIRLKRFRKIVKRVSPKLYIRFKRLKWRRFWWKRKEKRKLHGFFDFFSFLIPIQRNRRIYMLRREYKVYLNLVDYLNSSYNLVANRDMLFRLPSSKRAVSPYISARSLNKEYGKDFSSSLKDFQLNYFKVFSDIRNTKSIFLWTLRKPESFFNLSFPKKDQFLEFQNIFLYSDFFFSFRVLPFFDFDDFFFTHGEFLLDEDFSISQDEPLWWYREVLVWNEIVFDFDYYYYHLFVPFFFLFWALFILIFIFFFFQVFSFFTFLDFDFFSFEYFRGFYIFFKTLFLEFLREFFWED